MTLEFNVAWWLSGLALAHKAGRLQEILGLSPRNKHYLYVMIEICSLVLMTLKFECEILSGMVAQWFSQLIPVKTSKANTCLQLL